MEHETFIHASPYQVIVDTQVYKDIRLSILLLFVVSDDRVFKNLYYYECSLICYLSHQIVLYIYEYY